MKNYLKLSIVSAVLIISTSVFAQVPAKKETKQEPKKEKQDTQKTKKGAAADTTKKSGTRMAINEQGMPSKKNKTKAAKAEPIPTAPTPKDK